MSGSFDFNAANFAPLPTKIGTPTATPTSTLSTSVTVAQQTLTLKSNRLAVQMRPNGAQASFDPGIRLVLMLSFDGGTTFTPFKTYSAIPGVHTAAPATGFSGVFDIVDVQATHARVDSYGWGATPISGFSISVRLFG